MIIDKNIKKYIVFSEDTILHALEKISRNKLRIVFAVSENGVLDGVLSDGDFRRWLVRQESINLELPVSIAINSDYIFCNEETTNDGISRLFSERIAYIPILDGHKRLVAVATQDMKGLAIGDYEICDNAPCFIIAEIGYNHNGDYGLAKKLVDEAINSGADCVKFQMRSMESLYRKIDRNQYTSEDLGTEYVLDLLCKFQLKDNQMYQIFDYCHKKRIIPICTPWDIPSLKKLDQYGMQAFKLASADFTNHELIEAMANTCKPMVCSVGMSTEYEIKIGVSKLKRLGAKYALLHCISTYPPPFKDIHLKYIKRLKEIGECPVGYSGHERGIFVPIAAAALDAKIIEKHFTLDKTLEGNDHKISLLPGEFKLMVEGIRQVESSLGKNDIRTISQGELINRENLSKSLTINRDLKKGKKILSEYIEIKSPGKGLPPYRKNDLIGTISKRDLSCGDFFHHSDIEEEAIKPRSYQIGRPWGVPVRFHDMKKIYDLSNMDLLEFHLSYSDLNLNICDYFHDIFKIDFLIHCPELFSNDHILDLSSEDRLYRDRSKSEIRKVIELSRALQPFFPNTKKPRIILNVGGFSMNSHISVEKRKNKYNILSRSLSEIDTRGVELIPQTMPPFPWHFGGQRYHNLFLEPSEIMEFCNVTGMRVCLDISHSKLACNYYNWSFSEFLRKLGPYTAHIHLADASGVDGEGLQLGTGEIDVFDLVTNLDEFIPGISMIPEIWQGHKNNGEGFWIAMDRYESARMKKSNFSNHSIV